MSENKKQPVRIVLTEEQRKQIQAETGHDATTLEFTAEELEQRIAPARFVY
ncbi:MAG TPA: hypothetical protein VFZ04_04605 [Longimicrobiales bacterium]